LGPSPLQVNWANVSVDESMNLGVFVETVNRVNPERPDSGRLQYHVHDEKGSLCMEIDRFRAEVKLWGVVFEASSW
jgi:hypothetical protein